MVGYHTYSTAFPLGPCKAVTQPHCAHTRVSTLAPLLRDSGGLGVIVLHEHVFPLDPSLLLQAQLPSSGSTPLHVAPPCRAARLIPMVGLSSPLLKPWISRLLQLQDAYWKLVKALNFPTQWNTCSNSLRHHHSFKRLGKGWFQSIAIILHFKWLLLSD